MWGKLESEKKFQNKGLGGNWIKPHILGMFLTCEHENPS